MSFSFGYWWMFWYSTTLYKVKDTPVGMFNFVLICKSEVIIGQVIAYLRSYTQHGVSLQSIILNKFSFAIILLGEILVTTLYLVDIFLFLMLIVSQAYFLFLLVGQYSLLLVQSSLVKWSYRFKMLVLVGKRTNKLKKHQEVQSSSILEMVVLPCH